jgi:hypothetical protein
MPPAPPPPVLAELDAAPPLPELAPVEALVLDVTEAAASRPLLAPQLTAKAAAIVTRAARGPEASDTPTSLSCAGSRRVMNADAGGTRRAVQLDASCLHGFGPR